MRLRLSPAACKTAIIVGISFATGIGFILVCEQFQAHNGKQSNAQPVAPEQAAAPLAAPSQAMQMGGQLIPAPVSPQIAGMPQTGAQQAQAQAIPGRDVEYSQTVSGYPIATGRKAVDYFDPQQGAYVTGTKDPGATAGWAPDDYTVSPDRIGRNGLLSNPSVDPPSSHGAAYSRSY